MRRVAQTRTWWAILGRSRAHSFRPRSPTSSTTMAGNFVSVFPVLCVGAQPCCWARCASNLIDEPHTSVVHRFPPTPLRGRWEAGGGSFCGCHDCDDPDAPVVSRKKLNFVLFPWRSRQGCRFRLALHTAPQVQVLSILFSFLCVVAVQVPPGQSAYSTADENNK